MNPKIAAQIQEQQDHGRAKWGGDANNLEHDDRTPEEAWHAYIDHHNERAALGTAMERRMYLIKVAGLAVSAVEAFDRKLES